MFYHREKDVETAGIRRMYGFIPAPREKMSYLIQPLRNIGTDVKRIGHRGAGKTRLTQEKRGCHVLCGGILSITERHCVIFYSWTEDGLRRPLIKWPESRKDPLLNHSMPEGNYMVVCHILYRVSSVPTIQAGPSVTFNSPETGALS